MTCSSYNCLAELQYSKITFLRNINRCIARHSNIPFKFADFAAREIPLKTRSRQMSRKRRRESCLESYLLTGDKKCDCRCTLIRPFKLLRSREMIDARIPHLHRKSGNRSCLAMFSVDEKIFLSDSTFLSPSSLLPTLFYPPPLRHTLFFFLFAFSLLSCHFKKLFILRLTKLKLTIIDISTTILSNFLWRTLRNNFSDGSKERLFARFCLLLTQIRFTRISKTP